MYSYQCVCFNVNIQLCLSVYMGNAPWSFHILRWQSRHCEVCKRSCWIRFSIFHADLGQSPLELKMYYFKNIVVFFYGAPSWHLEGTMVQSVCIDWRKALRGVWSVNNRTHSDIITSLSKQFPYFVFKEQVYQNFQQLFVMLEQYCALDSDDKLSYM